MKKSSWTGVALAAAVLAAAPALEGCSSTKSVKEQTSDVWITSKVKSKLTLDPEINPFNIDVETSEGVVYLIGTVPTRSDAEEAVELARQTEGVVEVVSHLKIESEDEMQGMKGKSEEMDQ